MGVPVLVVFTVRFVVPPLVADDVGQREAVMACNEIDAGERRSATPLEDVRRTAQTLRELAGGVVVTAPEAAHGVPEAIVPLRPVPREMAELVAAGARVPGLGDQLGATARRRR